MKSIPKEDLIKLKKALVAAYHEKEKAEVSHAWQAKLMGHIRSRGPLYPKVSYIELFQHFVWQLAPVACILILVLGAVMSRFDFVSDYEIAKMFIEEPTDFGLLTLYK